MTGHARARRRGIEAERLAGDYLAAQGLETVSRNFRARGGEIDLVMRDRGVLVFVEVRSRASEAFMRASESVDARKRRRLLHAAQRFLQMQGDSPACRFDVVTVTGTGPRRKIEWLKRAFDA